MIEYVMEDIEFRNVPFSVYCNDATTNRTKIHVGIIFYNNALNVSIWIFYTQVSSLFLFFFLLTRYILVFLLGFTFYDGHTLQRTSKLSICDARRNIELTFPPSLHGYCAKNVKIGIKQLWKWSMMICKWYKSAYTVIIFFDHFISPFTLF